MSRRRWLAGMGTVLLLMSAAVGCKVTDFSLVGLFQSSPLGPDERVVSGSVETVAASFKTKLESLGIRAELKREDQVVRVHATTLNGDQFDLVFTKHKGKDGGEATHIHFEWDGNADPSFKGEMRAHFTAVTPAKP